MAQLPAEDGRGSFVPMSALAAQGYGQGPNPAMQSQADIRFMSGNGQFAPAPPQPARAQRNTLDNFSFDAVNTGQPRRRASTMGGRTLP